MGGLQVRIAEGVSNRMFVQSATNPINWTLNVNYMFTMDPQRIAGIFQGIAPTTDTKYYLRQHKVWGFIQNQSNAPVWIQRTAIRFRRNISLSDYPSIIQLLNSAAINTTLSPLMPITTANAAQKLIKFGKTKWIRITAGESKFFKVNQKFNSLPLSRDVNANPFYLATRMTKGYVYKIEPFLAQYRDNTTQAVTGYAPASVNVTWHYADYVSYYQVGLNDPDATATGIPLPVSGTDTWSGIFTDHARQSIEI